MQTLASTRLLTVGGVTWTYADAVLVGLLTGIWPALEQRLARGLAIELDPAEEAVNAAAVDFRRAHRLLAAEDFRGWMAARGLTTDDVRAHVVIGLRLAARPDSRVLAPAADVEPALRAAAFCTGTLRDCAGALAERAVAQQAVADAPAPSQGLVAELTDAARAGLDRGLRELPDLPQRSERVIGAHGARQAFVDDIATEQRLHERLRTRRLDLTRLSYELVTLADADAAREAALCVRADGMALGQVAVKAGVECARHEAEIGTLDGPLRAGVAAGRPGDLVGPLPGDDGHRLVAVRARHPPQLADGPVRRRIGDELVGQALQRAGAGRVEWHGHV